MRLGRLALAACVGAALLSACPELEGSDAWYEEYQGALKAISGRHWKDAETKLLAALRTGPPPGRRVRAYGVRFIDYLPEYHLGLVYFNQQRYVDALEQFAKVQATGIVNSADAEYRPLADMISACRLRTGSAANASEAVALVGFARDLAAKGSLKEARQALEAARSRDPRATGLEDAFADLGRRESEQQAAAAQAKPTEPEPHVAAASAETVSRAPDAGRASDRVAADRAPVGPTPTPTPTPAAPVARGVDAAVAAAFESFYAGRYAASAPLFRRLAAQPGPNRAVLLVYAACSKAGAALLQPTATAAELDDARRLFREAGPAAPRIAASDPLLSPRIVEVLTR